MTTITLTTETGRTINIGHEAARTLEAAGVSPFQMDLDIDGLIAGKSEDALLLFCLDGSDGQDAEWHEYVAACRSAADAETGITDAAQGHVADVLAMGVRTAAQLATDADPTETWTRLGILDAAGLPRDASDEQFTTARILLANSIREAARRIADAAGQS